MKNNLHAVGRLAFRSTQRIYFHVIGLVLSVIHTLRHTQTNESTDDMEDEKSCYSSDCSSSLSYSSWNSSSSDLSSSDDGSDGSSFSSPSRRKVRNHRRRNELQYVEDSFFRLPSLMRHRRTKAGDNAHKYAHVSSDESHASKMRKRRRGSKRKVTRLHWSSGLLAISLLAWCGVQIATTEYVQNSSSDLFNTRIDRMHDHGHRNHNHRHGDATNQHLRHPPFPHRPPPSIKKKDSASKKEMLKPGCELDPEWQTPQTNSKLLSCLLLHELDISEALSSAQKSSTRRPSLSSSAYLASGLWRDVWKIQDNIIMQDKNSTIDARNFVVLKTMKPEHEVIHRNLERHRREAATMSHLTKSPYIADLYAYCGNSILTEFASQDLSRTLKRNTKDGQKERRRIIKDSNRAIREREPRKSIRQLSINDNISDTSSSLSSSLSTTLALRTRIDWALQASKAIAYMHRSDVIHADITTKQFLVISSSLGTRKDGNDELNNNIQVKLNDFNRCRFVPRRQQSLGKMTAAERTNITYTQSTYGNTTGTCTVRIPSAPGSYRSPEEYSDKELTPQIDVFSLGHVLYEIWTGGQTPWNDVGVKRIKNMVMDGVLPIKLKKLKDWDDQSERHLTGNNTYDMNEDFLSAENERAFGRLITKCYAVDPKLRITADGLVRELTNLFESVRGQNNV